MHDHALLEGNGSAHDSPDRSNGRVTEASEVIVEIVQDDGSMRPFPVRRYDLAENVGPDAPIRKLLEGKKVGDEFEMKTRSSAWKGRIVHIN